MLTDSGAATSSPACAPPRLSTRLNRARTSWLRPTAPLHDAQQHELHEHFFEQFEEAWRAAREEQLRTTTPASPRSVIEHRFSPHPSQLVSPSAHPSQLASPSVRMHNTSEAHAALFSYPHSAKLRPHANRTIHCAIRILPQNNHKTRLCKRKTRLCCRRHTIAKPPYTWRISHKL